MRKPPTPTIVTISVFTTVTVVLWIFVSVYSILIKDAPIDVPASLLEPIEPRLDTQVLKSVSDREFFREDQTNPFTVEPRFVVNQPVASNSAE